MVNFTLAAYEGLPYLDLRPGPHTHRISKGIDCKNKTEKCPITAGGYVGEKPTLNITTDSPDSIFKLIGHTKNGYNFTSILSDIGTHHYEILIGTSGWVTFTPRESCVTGTLTGCQGDIVDGTVVRACTPYLQDNVIEGKFAWAERVPSEYDLSCNPANTTAAKTSGNATDYAHAKRDKKIREAEAKYNEEAHKIEENLQDELQKEAGKPEKQAKARREFDEEMRKLEKKEGGKMREDIRDADEEVLKTQKDENKEAEHLCWIVVRPLKWGNTAMANHGAAMRLKAGDKVKKHFITSLFG
ncbi:hypothetical protein D6C84_07065 [Aureobasidium pullulans]|uniref:Uncharacterized protein n=1 Tax=Aureobasidium pullulans TaxID=5580 RepID=A0A4S9XRU9_AURPU|nr:hypothetical protein D6C84_07065 [Aureobasidium pullulans]